MPARIIRPQYGGGRGELQGSWEGAPRCRRSSLAEHRLMDQLDGVNELHGPAGPGRLRRQVEAAADVAAGDVVTIGLGDAVELPAGQCARHFGLAEVVGAGGAAADVAFGQL